MVTGELYSTISLFSFLVYDISPVWSFFSTTELSRFKKGSHTSCVSSFVLRSKHIVWRLSRIAQKAVTIVIVAVAAATKAGAEAEEADTEVDAKPDQTHEHRS